MIKTERLYGVDYSECDNCKRFLPLAELYKHQQGRITCWMCRKVRFKCGEHPLWQNNEPFLRADKSYVCRECHLMYIQHPVCICEENMTKYGETFLFVLCNNRLVKL